MGWIYLHIHLEAQIKHLKQIKALDTNNISRSLSNSQIKQATAWTKQRVHTGVHTRLSHSTDRQSSKSTPAIYSRTCL